MSVMNNTPTVKGKYKGYVDSMKEGDHNSKCNFCGTEEELVLVAVFSADTDVERLIDPDRVIWLCDKHYEKLNETGDYRIRELPPDKVELGHTDREEIEEQDDDYIVILVKENENKWFKAPDILEMDLESER